MWDHHSDKKEKQIRKRAYISKFSAEELRSDIYNPNKVYRISRKSDKYLTVQIIWSGEAEVQGADENEIEFNSVRPFDLEMFLNLT